MQVDINLYHELRKENPARARELVRKVLKQNRGNVSITARILKIDRKTVRRARDGTLNDLSRKPKRVWNRIDSEFEELIVNEAKRTGFGYRRLSKYLSSRYGLMVSENTVKSVLKRRKPFRRKARVRRGSRRLYNYESLLPFERFQLDTKHLLDKSSLPERTYNHIKEKGLPVYEWNLIDVATRLRFTAYSYRLSSIYGYLFILLCILWLRMHNVRTGISIRVDNGHEFCGGSTRKLKEWNLEFGVLDCELCPIPPGAKHLQGIIENSHRRDDEEFLIPFVERVSNTYQFLSRAQSWQDTWNFYRPHFGVGMNGRTPFEVLKSKWDRLTNLNVACFPVVLLDDLFVSAMNLGLLWGGEYVLTSYHL